MVEESLVGKTVKLKSGGTVMTVREVLVIDEIENALCEWSVEGKPKSKSYPVAMLVVVPPPKSGPRFKSIIRR